MDDDNELSDEEARHYSTLGELVASAALLEFIVFHFLASRAQITLATANVLIGKDNFDANLSRLGRLVAASEITPDAKQAYRDWSKRAQAAMAQRNQFVHSVWQVPGWSPTTITRLVRHRDPVEEIVTETMDLVSVERLVSTISALAAELIHMAGDLGVLG